MNDHFGAAADAALHRPATSYEAGRAVRKDTRMTQVAQVLDVMRKAAAQGVRDLTNNELTDRLQQAYPATHWHQGKTSARVKGMLDAQQLVRLDLARPCTSPSSSSRHAHPVRLAPRQERLLP